MAYPSNPFLPGIENQRDRGLQSWEAIDELYPNEKAGIVNPFGEPGPPVRKNAQEGQGEVLAKLYAHPYCLVQVLDGIHVLPVPRRLVGVGSISDIVRQAQLPGKGMADARAEGVLDKKSHVGKGGEPRTPW